LAFQLAVEAAGMRHRYIKPSSGAIALTEFWSRHAFSDRIDAEPKLGDWKRRYNHERFSLALAGRTPAEKLAACVVACASSTATVAQV